MGAKWDPFGLWAVFAVINYIGALAFLIGLFVTIPMTVLAQALAYRQLLTQSEAP